MIDHVSVGVRDLARSRRFYDAVLKPLGLVRTLNFGRGSDWGTAAGQTGVEFTITLEASAAPSAGQHICFLAPNREAVREFYRAALENGGRDDGPPGLRPIYHPDYFGGFVLDPDGHRVEAVCHVPTPPRAAI
jgi:catechol 2,3-dioxygenase-like lactoylglutathione lyase family enzyme